MLSHELQGAERRLHMGSRLAREIA
jgi:hypothetical protein